MRRHERGIGGTPPRSLTERLQRVKGTCMEQEAGDLSAIEAAQRIIATHNDDLGTKGGYHLYDPYIAERIGTGRPAPRIGYVSLAAGHPIERNPLTVEHLLAKINQARGEQANPSSGRVF